MTVTSVPWRGNESCVPGNISFVPVSNFFSKSIHCAMKPIRIQLECPYNSSNGITYTHVWVYMFLYSLHKKYTFLYISSFARGREDKCAVSFREWISFWTNRVSQWFNGLERIFYIIDSVSNLWKLGLAAVYFWFYCHIYLSMADLNQPRCQHKNTFSKLLFNYQYWQQFLYFRPQKENKCINNNLFNKGNFH